MRADRKTSEECGSQTCVRTKYFSVQKNKKGRRGRRKRNPGKCVSHEWIIASHEFNVPGSRRDTRRQTWRKLLREQPFRSPGKTNHNFYSRLIYILKKKGMPEAEGVPRSITPVRGGDRFRAEKAPKNRNGLDYDIRPEQQTTVDNTNYNTSCRKRVRIDLTEGKRPAAVRTG